MCALENSVANFAFHSQMRTYCKNWQFFNVFVSFHLWHQLGKQLVTLHKIGCSLKEIEHHQKLAWARSASVLCSSSFLLLLKKAQRASSSTDKPLLPNESFAQYKCCYSTLPFRKYVLSKLWAFEIDVLLSLTMQRVSARISGV